MAIRDFHDLIRLLEEHPEWRADLRRLLLTEELLRLPERVAHLEELLTRLAEQVQALAEAQRRTEERLEALTARVDALARRVDELAEAQKRTEERVEQLARRVDELAEAQKRTEERVEQLAEAQRRTEERVEVLARRVDELAEAQRRTEERVEQLAEAQRRTEEQVARLTLRVDQLSLQVGHLSNLLGGAVEDDADDILRFVLRQKGFRLLQEPRTVDLDGEVDVLAQAEDPAGRPVWVVVEAKVRLRRREVLAWVRRLGEASFREALQEEGVRGPVLAYAYGIRVYRDAEEVAQAEGVGLLDGRGERLAPRERWLE